MEHYHINQKSPEALWKLEEFRHGNYKPEIQLDLRFIFNLIILLWSYDIVITYYDILGEGIRSDLCN